MATLVLSAAGAALGGMSSGTILGMTGAVVGRAVGSTLGRVIDQRLMGSGSDAVERGRIDRFRLTGVGEGSPIARVFGRMRVGGHVIWSTQFVETAATSGGGKGAAPQPKATSYSYSVSLAIALCEGEIRRVGRIWADGVELDLTTINMRVYKGTENQGPDSIMEAVEGLGQVPAYRGVAYVVFEDLDLSPFGNRVPQFAFEVVRFANPEANLPAAAADMVRAVAMMPGTGEYVLSTQPITYQSGFGNTGAANISAEGGGTDFAQTMKQLRDSVPNLQSVSLIYSWFGDDLRAGRCSVKPKVEDLSKDGSEMPWSAGGINRSDAEEVSRVDNRPVYGGTPADNSILEAIQEIQAGGQSILFYPFLLMEILEENTLTDPWTGKATQPAFPWRGRITGERALGAADSTDGTAANKSSVDTFFGTVTPGDFVITPGHVLYTGPDEWSYRRFILHGAALCAAAGGVEAFCIGSEMRSLTQMRDNLGFPAVEQFRVLAAMVRQILPNSKLSYAADWSEYFGYHPQDESGDFYFHLDPLWADDAIDFIAIDNYMPLSDWRDGSDHTDAYWGEEYSINYLQSNIEGGEGYHWYYGTMAARDAQRRLLISDGAEGWAPTNVVASAPPGPLGTLLIGESDRRNKAVFVGKVRFPFVPKDGVIWEHGASVIGAWLGVRGNGSTVRLRAGSGSLSLVQSTSDTAVLDVPTANLPFDGDVHEIMWELQPTSPGRIRLFIDGAVVGEATTDGGGQLKDGQWAGVDPGGWLTATSGLVVGEPSTPWSAPEGASDLRFARNVFPVSSPLTSYVYRYKDLRGWWMNEHIERRGGNLLSESTNWVPQSKPIWFTEIGCAAVDKGTNQPNKFLDKKSSESAVPYYSNGRRDDVIQSQYIRALLSYWDEEANNPISSVYEGPMLALDRAHLWAWDARPWPAFPNDRGRWSDGANWARGHWFTGRADYVPLDHVVAELCERAGLIHFDVSRLYGLVRGYLSGETETARAQLQSLMLAYGFNALERDGVLVFAPLPQVPEFVLDGQSTAVDDEGRGGIIQTRSADAEVTGRVRLSYTRAEQDYDEHLTEAVFPGDDSDAVSASDLPLALTGAEARGIAERWLAEARVARDQLQFSLPPSTRRFGAGALLATADGATWRIDRVEDRGLRMVEAVRVEPSVSEPSEEVEEVAPASRFVPPLPVGAAFMDLPLLSGDEQPHIPHIAVAATPWPGSVALYSSPSSDGFALNKIIERGSIVGTLETPLASAIAGLWDRSGPMRIRISGGALSSAEQTAVLNGANVAAIGSGDDGDWEVIQFSEATLVGTDEWDIGKRLRGQQGTESVMPEIWPQGSLFVLLDGAPQQYDLPSSARGLLRHYRIGPAGRSVDDSSYVERILAFKGVGLRPYAPVHLRARHDANGCDVSWIRRSRIDADSWESLDVPLGEASEAYLLRVSDADGVKREEIITTSSYYYSDVQRSIDGTGLNYSIEVAQLSDRFGPGPFARIEVDE